MTWILCKIGFLSEFEASGMFYVSLIVSLLEALNQQNGEIINPFILTFIMSIMFKGT